MEAVKMGANMGFGLKGKSHKVWFVTGLLAVLAMAVPYLVLGQDAIVTYHDQLDGEMIAYILQARHLFSGDVLPEFMNGAGKTALVPPAPGFVLFFLTGHYFEALVLMQLLGSLVGFWGMYLLVREITGKEWIGALVGVLYAFLPFLPVYGLSQYGIPLLLYLLLQVKRGRMYKRAVCYAGIYALCSSLVLVGFGVLGVVLLWMAWLLWCRHKRPSEISKSALAATGIFWLSMLCVYILENLRLLQQTLAGAGGQVSHKEEYLLQGESFWGTLWTGFTAGGQHSEDFHGLILIGAVAAVLLSLLQDALRQKKGEQPEGGECRSLRRWILIMLGCNLAFALISALWSSAWGVGVRSSMKALGAFQLDRLLWMAPCLWYAILGAALALALRLFAREGGALRMIAGGCAVVLFGMTAATGARVLLESNLKPNLQKLRNPEYSLLSYRDYYAIGVLEQVEEYLLKETGQSREAYRVASLGIDPAAALYHGFYCLDGYSNNYSLDYKHSFRNIIQPELDKSAYLLDYFDNWGNRCYLFSAETPNYYTIEKNGFFFRDYSINTDAFCDLGGDYILSAAYIANASELGLRLLREEPFETEGSYYRIFLYEVGGLQ